MVKEEIILVYFISFGFENSFIFIGNSFIMRAYISLGTLFYNPSGVATYKNLCADINANDLDGNFDGTIRLFAFDYYGNPALQGPGNLENPKEAIFKKAGRLPW